MLTGPWLHEVQEVALEMVMLLDQQERGAARLDEVRLALLSSGRRMLEDVFPALGGRSALSVAPAQPAATPPEHSGRENEPHPSLLEWSVPSPDEEAEMLAWIAERSNGSATAAELEGEGWV